MPSYELQPPPTCDPLSRVSPVFGEQVCHLLGQGLLPSEQWRLLAPPCPQPWAGGGVSGQLMALSNMICACQPATGAVSPLSVPSISEPSWEPCPLAGSETAGRVWGSGRPRCGLEILSQVRRQASGNLIQGRKNPPESGSSILVVIKALV